MPLLLSEISLMSSLQVSFLSSLVQLRRSCSRHEQQHYEPAVWSPCWLVFCLVKQHISVKRSHFSDIAMSQSKIAYNWILRHPGTFEP